VLALDVSTASPAGWKPVNVGGGTVTAGSNNSRQSLLVTTPTNAEATLSHDLTAMPSSIEFDAYVTTPASEASAGGVFVALECSLPTVALRVFLDGLNGLAFTANPQAATSYAPIGRLYDGYHTFHFTFSGATVTATVDGNNVPAATGTTPFTGAQGCVLTVGANLAAAASPATPAKVAYSRVCIR
jgi:hypothetical protein